jgi:hypothetical protein
MKNKIIIIILSSLILILIITFIVLSAMAPIRAIRLVNENYPDSGMIEEYSSAQIDMMKKEVFMRSRLKMAEADSACVSINLVDSVIIVEIQGVTLLETKIQKLWSSKIYSRYSKQAFYECFATPFVIDSDYCTIPKEFFNIKYAPEDTIAAQAPKTMPDTTLKYPVYFILYLDRGLMVDIRQSDTLLSEIYKEYTKHIRDQKIKKMWNSLYRFEVPAYDPAIRIEIPHKDARSIYKALPKHAQVAVIL